MADELHLDQQFGSFREFEACLNEYEVKNGFHFTLIRSEILENCKVKGPFPPGLLYYQRTYTCDCAGESRSIGNGIRNRRIAKTGCPAQVVFTVKKKSYLKITKFVSEHNHERLGVAEPDPPAQLEPDVPEDHPPEPAIDLPEE